MFLPMLLQAVADGAAQAPATATISDAGWSGTLVAVLTSLSTLLGTIATLVGILWRKSEGRAQASEGVGKVMALGIDAVKEKLVGQGVVSVARSVGPTIAETATKVLGEDGKAILDGFLARVGANVAPIVGKK